jgi:hypothetical protein
MNSFSLLTRQKKNPSTHHDQKRSGIIAHRDNSMATDVKTAGKEHEPLIYPPGTPKALMKR